MQGQRCERRAQASVRQFERARSRSGRGQRGPRMRRSTGEDGPRPAHEGKAVYWDRVETSLDGDERGIECVRQRWAAERKGSGGDVAAKRSAGDLPRDTKIAGGPSESSRPRSVGSDDGLVAHGGRARRGCGEEAEREGDVPAHTPTDGAGLFTVLARTARLRARAVGRSEAAAGEAIEAGRDDPHHHAAAASPTWTTPASRAVARRFGPPARARPAAIRNRRADRPGSASSASTGVRPRSRRGRVLMAVPTRAPAVGLIVVAVVAIVISGAIRSGRQARSRAQGSARGRQARSGGAVASAAMPTEHSRLP